MRVQEFWLIRSGKLKQMCFLLLQRWRTKNKCRQYQTKKIYLKTMTMTINMRGRSASGTGWTRPPTLAVVEEEDDLAAPPEAAEAQEGVEPAPAPRRPRARRQPVEGEVLDATGRIRVIPNAQRNRLLDSSTVSRELREIFQSRWWAVGTAWRFLPEEAVSFYFEEFKKKFFWEDEFEERVIRSTFEKHAANRYSDRLSTYKTSREKDVSITDDVWQAWERVWDSDEAKKKSAQARANRMSEPAGAGTGPVRHTGGSMSALKHKAVLARELGREPTHAEVHKRMHTLKADPTRFVDERARIAAERFEQEMLAATQTAEGSTASTPVDPDQVYLAVEGVKKRRVYGLGSVGSEFVASQRGTSSRRPGSSSQTVSPAADERFRTDLIAQFADTIRDQVQIAVAAAMQQMQQRAQGDVLPTPPPPPPPPPPPATDDGVTDDDITDL
ncbi:uncharacterized protein LOC126659623 isoform X2 [Mercurialis annua]|uniref:uncharacterized protein LOC126659623 isoform X2 n=1 Tax=Mercurialis annua TaxID=3986 RepID=UPI00215F4948|nr:uncharacterized protein LOC126659623 isoform X2 [Mercurialis annua]